MAPASPTAPQRHQFYNVVCGGTWLNRDQYNAALSTHRAETREYLKQQDLLFAAQQDVIVGFSPALERLVRGTFLPEPLQKLYQSLTLPLVNGLLFIQRPLQLYFNPVVVDPAIGSATLNPSKSQPPGQSAMAQMLAYFLGWRREARSNKPLAEEEIEARANTDFQASAKEVFQLDKVGGASAGGMMGGGGGSGGGFYNGTRRPSTGGSQKAEGSETE